MECEHDFVFDELHWEVVCRKCGHVLTAEEKRRICDHGMELLEAEETGEYISRKSAEGAVRDHWCDSSRMMEAIRCIPAADVAPVVHGEWIRCNASLLTHCQCGAYPVNLAWYRCSVCGRTAPKKEPYCHCGARMDL